MAKRGRKPKSYYEELERQNGIEATEAVKPEEAEQEEQKKRRQVGETHYICIDCGGDLVKYKSGRHHPGFLIRNFRCIACGRETDQYVTQVRQVHL